MSRQDVEVRNPGSTEVAVEPGRQNDHPTRDGRTANWSSDSEELELLLARLLLRIVLGDREG